MTENDAYLDTLKVLEFAAEGGGEALYRLLPYGSAHFIWRTYGNSINEDEAGAEVWADFTEEYDGISDYLNQRGSMLAYLYPLHVDAQFRGEVFTAFMQSVRQRAAADADDLFQTRRRWGLDGRWPDWQKHLQLTAPADSIVVHSAFGEKPVAEITLDYGALRDVQQLLNLVYNAFLLGLVPAGSYGKERMLYDLIGCDELVLPRDDRNDRLSVAGVKQGGQWLLIRL